MDAGAVAARFGLGARARLSGGPVTRGKQGALWRLDTSDGAWAVKVPFRAVTEDDVRAATAFHEAAFAAGVPAPEVRRADDGNVFADAGGTRVRVYGWVDVGPPDALLDPALVGDVVAAIHQVPYAGGHGRPDPWHTEPVGAARWDALVADLTREGAPFAAALADLRDELVELEDWIEAPEVVRTCHRDLWADNVLRTPRGGVCVVDWEDSGPADPGHELGCVVFEFGRSDPGRARALVAAYRAAGGPAALTRRGQFSMLIAQLGHITETAARDWLRPNDRSPDRAAAAEWVGEVFDEPHTRAVLGALLATVRV